MALPFVLKHSIQSEADQALRFFPGAPTNVPRPTPSPPEKRKKQSKKKDRAGSPTPAPPEREKKAQVTSPTACGATPKLSAIKKRKNTSRQRGQAAWPCRPEPHDLLAGAAEHPAGTPQTRGDDWERPPLDGLWWRLDRFPGWNSGPANPPAFLGCFFFFLFLFLRLWVGLGGGFHACSTNKLSGVHRGFLGGANRISQQTLGLGCSSGEISNRSILQVDMPHGVSPPKSRAFF